jgi:hypothetical protein
MKMLLGDLSAKAGRDDIFKPIVRNKSLREIINDDGVRGVDSATSKNLVCKTAVFPHHIIYKFT